MVTEGRIEQLTDPSTLCARPLTRELVGTVAHPTGGATGEWLVIRPEAVRFAGRSRLDCVFDGTIEDVIYVGDATKYKVRIANDLIVLAKLQNRSGEMRGERGDRFRLGWQVDDAIIVEV